MNGQSQNNRVRVFGVVFAIGLITCMVIVIGLISFIGRNQIAPQPLIFPTFLPNSTRSPSLSAPVPTGSGKNSDLQGKIAYVCQLFRTTDQDQICIMNADGTGWRRLTTTDNIRSFYPSMTPDGNSVVFSSNIDGNFKIYEVNMAGEVNALGDNVGVAPEVSPDNKFVVFANSNGQQDAIWIMDRDGSHPRRMYAPAWDPTWSPDSKYILFATYIDGKPQLAIISIEGKDFRQVTDLPTLRGRSDWSPDGQHIVTYSGDPWNRELYMLNSDGSNLHQVSPSGGNSQGPSFSPDGEWIAFTAYYGSIGNNNGCEIYIMRIDGSNLKRLTNNSYCDWQPRWGP